MEAEKMRNYKAYVGNPDHYDIIGLTQFSLLCFYGLQKYNTVLDIGCGSLRLGKYLISFLEDKNYFAVEPNYWLVQEAVRKENVDTNKSINIYTEDDFKLTYFNRKFDYLIANSIFIHACLEQIKTCLQEAYASMNNDSIFFFNFIEGKDNLKDEWSYPSSVTYRKETLKKITEKIGFEWEDINWYYPGKQSWVKLKKRNVV